jgi:hypothetical protein
MSYLNSFTEKKYPVFLFTLKLSRRYERRAPGGRPVQEAIVPAIKL